MSSTNPPPSPPPSKPTKPPSPPLNPLTLLLTTTTPTTTHLTRLLTQTPHLDALLLTASYTLHLTHSLLSHHPLTSRSRLTTTLSPLTALLDEFRTMLRLWGLLSIYNLAAKTYLSEEKKAVGMRVLTWAQIGALAVFQGLENGAYLAGRGVLGWRGERVGRAYRWSARAWMGYVGLELVRLGWEWGRLRGELTAGGKGGEVKGAEGKVVELSGEKDVQLVGEQRERVEREWGNFYRRLGVNAAYAPMTVHYSLEVGPLGEGSLGALGVVVAWLTFGKVWRETA